MSDPRSSPEVNALFAAGDERVVEAVRACDHPEHLRALADVWYPDPRPALRRALLRYVDEGCGLDYHQVLVKRLFKLAEKAGDDEAMAHFLVAFDRFSHRTVRKGFRFDSKSRRYVEEPTLTYDLRPPAVAPCDAGSGRPTGGTEFSRHTREYLKRRAFRYFRLLGFRDPARFRRGMAFALPLYQDKDLRTASRFLDAWGLCHVLYGKSPVLLRKPGGVRLAEGHALKELTPAPMFEDAWWEGFDELLAVFATAGSRTVRDAMLMLLRKHHADDLANLRVDRLLPLLRSETPEVQAFAVELLQSASGLESLPLADWLALLSLERSTVLPAICDLVQQHVSPDRLALAQCLELAASPAAPAAELGLTWAKSKPIHAEDLRALVRLCLNAKAPRIRADAAAWVVPVLEGRPETTPELIRELVDSQHREVRELALELMLRDARFKDQTLLWAALAESPWDDVRAALAKHLEERAKVLSPESVRHVWASVLLGVHRGGREKRRVVKQLADRIAQAPGEARSLLPLLSVSLRSVRAPERRGALAGLAQAAFREPRLRAAIATALPELKLFAEEAA
ncbi:MAG TPA: hypothetical protein VGK67_08955 [Myxococcales bacterium]|jgi:hypothetical protein